MFSCVNQNIIVSLSQGIDQNIHPLLLMSFAFIVNILGGKQLRERVSVFIYALVYFA